MYYEKSRDGQAREDAFRSLNYTTYFASSDGKIACCGLDYADSYWFDDGYGDTVRNFMWAIGAIPEFAPKGESHLLRSSSVVQKVTYGDRSIRYRTFDNSATEVLRLAYKPSRIAIGRSSLTEREDLNEDGYTIESLKEGDYIVRVRHTSSKEVEVAGL
jgi:hypothetical protein